MEFTLVGIPIIFVLISVFEISRGMWVYTTLGHAVREGVRFAIVHGENCSLAPNDCVRFVSDVAEVIQNAGIGLEASELELRFHYDCPNSPSACNREELVYPTLTDALAADTVMYPPAEFNTPPAHRIEIAGIYRFRSALSMFWPGAGGGMVFGVINFPASSRETIQF